MTAMPDSYYYPSDYYRYSQPYFTTVYYPSKVSLSMEELDILRAAAKRDKELKQVLYKFVHLLDAAVTFD